MSDQTSIQPGGDAERDRQLERSSGSIWIEPITLYVRTLRFEGPERTKRYYRIFGDLEYDLLALKAESAMMSLRFREIKRRLRYGLPIGAAEERHIGTVARELSEHLYARADKLRMEIVQAKRFRFDPVREHQSFLLFSDITTAIVGVDDPAIRRREGESLEAASEAYGNLDLGALLELHDAVQPFLGLPRRERLENDEERQWRRRLLALESAHPLCLVDTLDDPSQIEQRMSLLRRKIEVRQERLEMLAMVYLAAVKSARNFN